MNQCRDIERDVARLLLVTGFDREQLISRSRSAEDTRRRHLFAAVLHRLGYSHEQIGRVLHRHHSTVTHMMGMRYRSPCDIDRVAAAFELGGTSAAGEHRPVSYLHRVLGGIGCSLDELKSSGRSRRLCDKRRLFALLMTRGGYRSSEVARLLGRDQSSVTYLLNTGYLVAEEVRRLGSKLPLN